MIIYSVACTMDKSIAPTWEQFFLEKHLDDLVKTGCFTSYSFRKEINDLESNQVTYVSEYYALDMKHLNRYNEEFAPSLKQEVIELFGGKFTATRHIYSKIV